METNPLKGTYTVVAYKGDTEADGKFEFVLKELDEVTYLAAQRLIANGKETEAIKMIISALRVGGDDPVEFGKCLKAVLSARKAVLQMITPLDGELKKN